MQLMQYALHGPTTQRKTQARCACYCARTVMPNTHRRRRRDETVELRRVGGVNTPVGSRGPVYNFMC